MLFSNLEYTYNALDRRSRKHDLGIGSEQEYTRYYYNKDYQVLLETDEDDVELRTFVYGRGLDEVLVMTDAGTSDDYYYLHDHLNSVVAVVDEDGDVIERYEYDAYGKPMYYEGDYSELEATLIGNPYYFTGRRIDFVGHSAWMIQYNRNRFYDYETGRWLNQDPIGYQDGVNLYAYVNSNPMNRVDSMGLCDGYQNQNGDWVNPCELSGRVPDSDPSDEEADLAAALQGECDMNIEHPFCGPDMTEHLLKLMKYSENWARTQSWGFGGRTWFLFNNAPKMVWPSNASSKGNEGLTYKYTGDIICPTRPICKNTITLCDECVHDRWLGNFMFAFVADLIDYNHNLAREAANLAQKGDVSDPPWDTAAYEIAWENFEALKEVKNEDELCKLLKGNQELWQTANDVSVPTHYVNYIGNLPQKKRRYPDPIASGYHSACEPCGFKPNNIFSDIVPGGGFYSGGFIR